MTPMSDDEAAIWRAELAPSPPPTAPSPPMATKRGKAEKGEWYSTPNEKRHHKPKRLSLTPEALAALAYLAGPGMASAEVSAAIVERAERRGWTP